MDLHMGNSVACDACENPATQTLSSETSEVAAQWFIGRYCNECCTAVSDEMKKTGAAGKPASNIEGQWVHCSPSLIKAGVDCDKTPRRDCQCEHGGSHDHFVQYGKLAKHFCDAELPLRVLESNAGFYIGTFEDEGPDIGPCRESVEYFPTEAAAIAALETGEWTQKTSL